MIPNILQLIETGEYKAQRGPEMRIRLAGVLSPAYEYDFGDGVVLRTYTHTAWFLYLEGHLQNLTSLLTDEKITEAFSANQTNKYRALAGSMEARTFTVLGTGETREGAFFFENRYVGTFLNGAFVGHLFERIG